MVEIISFLTGSLTITLLVAYLFALWASLVLWTWFDVSDRTENIIYRLGALLIVATGMLLGFAIYLLLRPSHTRDEARMSNVEESILASQANLHTCHECLFVIKEEYSYCTNCSTKLVAGCRNCDKSINVGWNVCPYCGFKQQKAEDQRSKEITGVSTAPTGKKKIRTAAVFSSILGYLNRRNAKRKRKEKRVSAKKTKKNTRASKKRKS